MCLRSSRGFDHLVDDVLWRGTVGIAHAEVDNVLAAPASRGLELACDVEDVGGKAADTRKFVHGCPRGVEVFPSRFFQKGADCNG